MQSKYYQILLGRTYERLFWRGGCFIEVVFNIGLTVTGYSCDDFPSRTTQMLPITEKRRNKAKYVN